MKAILIIAAFIVVMALLFLLDRKGKSEKSEADKIYDEIFNVFNKVRWGVSLQEVREIFREKEFVTSEEFFGEVMGTGYMDKIDGRDVFISFYFPKEDEERLIRTDFYLLSMSANQSNLLFGKLFKEYGSPLAQDDAGGKSLSWDLGGSILTMESSETQELQVRLWDKEFYNKINESK